MRFGLLYETQRPFTGTNIDWNTLYKETIEQCVLAERMGFDNLWFVEHHFLTGFSASPCPEVILGALSQLTKRIRIGFGVCILPSHHPIHVEQHGQTRIRAATVVRNRKRATIGSILLGTHAAHAGHGERLRPPRSMRRPTTT